MPAPNFLAGAAFVKLYWSLGGQLGVNVLGMRVIGSPTFDQALANAIGGAIKTAFTANIATYMSTNTSLVRVGVRNWQTANQPEFRDTGAAVVGTAPTSDMLPPQTAMCITLRTALSGKSFTGRTYLGGFAEAQSGPTGVALGPAATAAIAFINAIDAATTANGLDLAVISRPAERQVVTRTTFHADGTSTIDTLSDSSAKAGAVNAVTAIESRSLGWETQRRRANSRGAAPTAFNNSLFVETLPATA